MENLCGLYDRLNSEIVVIGKSVTVFNQVVMVSRFARSGNTIFFSVQEKPHYVRRKARQNAYFTVPQTDTGGQVE